MWRNVRARAAVAEYPKIKHRQLYERIIRLLSSGHDYFKMPVPIGPNIGGPSAFDKCVYLYSLSRWASTDNCQQVKMGAMMGSSRLNVHPCRVFANTSPLAVGVIIGFIFGTRWLTRRVESYSNYLKAQSISWDMEQGRMELWDLLGTICLVQVRPLGMPISRIPSSQYWQSLVQFLHVHWKYDSNRYCISTGSRGFCSSSATANNHAAATPPITAKRIK